MAVAQWDEAFHGSLVTAAGNAEMARVHRDLHEHAKILKAIQRKRGGQAAMLLRAHIETSQGEVRKIALHQVHLAR